MCTDTEYQQDLAGERILVTCRKKNNHNNLNINYQALVLRASGTTMDSKPWTFISL